MSPGSSGAIGRPSVVVGPADGADRVGHEVEVLELGHLALGQGRLGCGGAVQDHL